MTILALAEMVSLIDEHEASNAVFDAYAGFLKDKLIVAKASPARGSGEDNPGNVARWSVVGDQRGIQLLLDTYVACAESLNFSVRHSKGRSIFLTIKNRSPVISVHPSKSSAANGLWFGVSVTLIVCTTRLSAG